MSTLPNFDDLPQWQQHIVRAVAELAPFVDKDARFSRKRIYALRPYLPYVVHTTGIAGTHILLNRDYKPIGLKTTDWVNYDDYPSTHISEAELQRVIPFFSYHQQAHRIEGRFFHDECHPFSTKHAATALSNRLIQLLASLHGVSVSEVTRYCAAQYGSAIHQ